ncbi:hypothetical protein Cpir12675_002026 [Ceratocystis pirilliformis]|uniref:Thioesterase domain-containing protein n=1 Tax=Ceratocystis pirilliformis TaxID=259994 RepID=A0ABR3ZEU7_9PEZI
MATRGIWGLRTALRPNIAGPMAKPRSIGIRWGSADASGPTKRNPKAVLLFRLLGVGFYTTFAVGFGALLTMATTVPASALGLSFYSAEEGLLRHKPADEVAREIERQMDEIELVKKLRADPDITESRPHLQMPDKVRAQNLTAKSLQGPALLATVPVTFGSKNGMEITTVMYLGRDLCGHPGIVHGGLLATILDEQSGFCCIPKMPQRMAVTAYLNINYRKPAKADGFFVVKTKIENLDGRKAFVNSTIESLPKDGSKGDVVADADSLFIQPKWANYMPRFIE